MIYYTVFVLLIKKEKRREEKQYVYNVSYAETPASKNSLASQM